MKDDMFSRDWEVSAEPETASKPPKQLGTYRVTFWHHLSLLVMSSALSLSSFLPLFFTGLSTSLQSQQAYLAFAIGQGQLPYVDTYSRAGFLYQSLGALSQSFGGRYWLIALQLLAFYMAGTYLYKLVYVLTDQRSLGFRGAGLFYLFNLAFGFGGFYPIQLATPLILLGLWFLATYIADLRSDEVFISYGLAAALAIALEPISLLFWLLAFLCLSVVNIRRGRWARGFYQNLAIILGVILVAYPLGYLVLNLQLVSPYLQQTLLGNLPAGWSLTGTFLLGLVVQLLALVATGLLTGLLLLPTYFGKMAEQVDLVVLVALSTLCYSLLALMTPTTDLYQLLLVLPFGLVLTALALGRSSDEERGPSLSRRRPSHVTVSYLKKHFYLPILVILASLSWTGYQFLLDQSVVTERQQIAAYLMTETAAETKISAWDNSAQIYLDSQRLSATQFPVVTVNTASSANRALLEDELLQGEADYLIINHSLALPLALDKKLQEAYEPIELEGITYFTLYRAK